MKKVLVLLSAYQGEKYITEQLKSLDAQRGVEVRVLIRDDGSPTEETMARIRAYHPEHMTVEVISGENVGFALSFSLLVREAFERGEPFDYYAFCDQDDKWLEDKLASAVDLLEADGASAASCPVTYCSNVMLADSDLRPMRLYYASPDSVRRDKPTALIQSGCIGCTMVFNHAALKMYATHMPQAPFYAHDFLMYQLCMFLGRVIYDPEPHILYRQHAANQIGAKDFWQRMRNRLDCRKHAGTLERQARLLLDLYGGELSEEDVALVSKLAHYKRSLRSRLALLTDRTIRYGSAESNFFYFLKVLGGML